ncbi:hypothetical protein ACVMFA_000523 [Bradyrhizobium liaoningense]
MQDLIDIVHADIVEAIALLPGGAKPFGVVAAAEEAGTMAGGERGGFI